MMLRYVGAMLHYDVTMYDVTLRCYDEMLRYVVAKMLRYVVTPKQNAKPFWSANSDPVL